MVGFARKIKAFSQSPAREATNLRTTSDVQKMTKYDMKRGGVDPHFAEIDSIYHPPRYWKRSKVGDNQVD